MREWYRARHRLIRIALVCLGVVLWPFTVGLGLSRIAHKTIPHSGLRVAAIIIIMLPSALVGTAWAAAITGNAPASPPPSARDAAPAKPATAPQPAAAAANQTIYKVVSVVDGDTIKVDINGKTTTVRLIGIDTPETVDPRKPVQCFGHEASDHAKQILNGQSVRLIADPTQDNEDKYGRLLRYVFLPDGTLFNREEIADGYAHEYTYDRPYQYQANFKATEAAARDADKGLWSSSTCNGNTTSAATAVVPVPTSSQPATSATTHMSAAAPGPKSAPAPAPAPQPAPSVYYANCTDVWNRLGHPIYQGDPGYSSKLDRDNDGTGCEEDPR